jgi:GMP synthase-like glutamine amidotransferase
MSRSWKAKSKKAQKKHAQRIKDRQDDMKLTTTVSAPSQKEGGSDVSMPVNELGKPGVPVTDVFMGIPPAIGASSQPQLKLIESQPKPVVDFLGKVIQQPSHSGWTPPGKRKVTVLRDAHPTYPDLWFSVYVEGDAHDEKMFAMMFVRSACRKAASPDEADLVVFTGGTDVDPALYGAKPYHKTERPDVERDAREMQLFLECKEKGIPMLGVCRGAQFLHVMQGGVLYQDVDNHNRPHPIISVSDGLIIPEASSVHHQMIYPDPKLGIQILATSNVANNRFKYKEGLMFTNTWDKRADVEAFFYRDTCVLGFQGHPEYAHYPLYTEWCMQQIDQFINCNPDCEWIGQRYRLKEDFRKERDAMETAIFSQTSPEGKSIMAQTEPKKKGKNKDVLTVPSTKNKEAK